MFMLKKLLKDHYNSNIFFTEEPGKESIICFKNMADFIINQKYKEKKEDIEEAKRILSAAANLIKAEIRENK